eukprot:CAMPEP_0204318014 /NCGR_PEP_ID=MMETSP0469-20131031/6297_1 /ASSEMBLY_ACC=CAM_ASM_000384 /TAXON_ID=2969 /ORGANISM="Oxyrrhis marina" /LENGTH=175 /DNA_ID=CAMNT_0051299013 /DNA_START=18 /DNA_END=540 /DNA_ORIENTATION=-
MRRAQPPTHTPHLTHTRPNRCCRDGDEAPVDGQQEVAVRRARAVVKQAPASRGSSAAPAKLAFHVEIYRESEHTRYGLHVVPPGEQMRWLNIVAVDGGLIGGWNAGQPTESQVQPGDRIVKVNGATGKEMVAAMKAAGRVRLLVERPGGAWGAILETWPVVVLAAIVVVPGGSGG